MTKKQTNPMAIARASILALALVCSPAVFGGTVATSTAQVVLTIPPEAILQQAAGDTLRVKIRLPREITAAVWAAEDSCSTPSSTARTFSRSGIFEISATDLGSGNVACLAFSDGSLTTSTRFSNLRSATGF